MKDKKDKKSGSSKGPTPTGSRSSSPQRTNKPETLPIEEPAIAPVQIEELERFRQQWKAEVHSKTVTINPASSSDSASTAISRSSSVPTLLGQEGISNRGSLGSAIGKEAVVVGEEDDLVSGLKDLSVVDDNEDPRKSKGFTGRLGTVTGRLQQARDAAIAARASTVDKGKQKEVNTSNLVSLEDQKKSLEIYALATHYERIGNLRDALIKYREALRMNPNVELEYRRLLQQQKYDPSARNIIGLPKSVDAENSEMFYTYYSLEQEQPSAKDDPDDLENPFYAGLRDKFSEPVLSPEDNTLRPVDFEPLDPEKPVKIAVLPNEIITHIMKFAIYQDISALNSISLVCKKMYLITREQPIWRFICERYYDRNLTNGLTLEQDLSVNYYSDWMRMFIYKPRIRKDGVYISRVNYVRQGLAEGTFTQPVHAVTYYRLLRFFDDTDHTAVSFTTTLEPAQAVKLLRDYAEVIASLATSSRKTGGGSRRDAYNSNKEKKEKGMMVGRYTFNNEGRIVIDLKDPDLPHMAYQMALFVRSTRRGRHNKLAWEFYTTRRVDADENDTTEVPKSQLKPYLFSKVRSYVG